MYFLLPFSKSKLKFLNCSSVIFVLNSLIVALYAKDTSKTGGLNSFPGMNIMENDIKTKTVLIIFYCNIIKDSYSYKKTKPKNADFNKVRVIKKNLVYVIGLAPCIAKSEVKNKIYLIVNIQVLSKKKYFGQYGKVVKIVVNKNKVFYPNGPSGP